MTRIEYGALKPGKIPNIDEVTTFCTHCDLRMMCNPEISRTVANGKPRIAVDGAKTGSEGCKLPSIIAKESPNSLLNI